MTSLVIRPAGQLVAVTIAEAVPPVAYSIAKGAAGVDSNAEQIDAEAATLARFDWTDTEAMTAGDGGEVVQGDGDTLATVPNTFDPGTADLVQATPALRPTYDNGAVFVTAPNELEMAFPGGAGAASSGLTLIYKGTGDIMVLASDLGGSTGYLFQVEQGNAGSIDNVGGSVFIDGELFTGNRSALYDVICDDAPHVLQLVGANLSAWSGLLWGDWQYAPGRAASGRILPVHYWNHGTADMQFLSRRYAFEQALALGL